MPPSAENAADRTDVACAMVLFWLRTAVPTILPQSFRRISKKEEPSKVLATLLHDAVVLADLLSQLDPVRLPPSSIMHATARNALSAPVSQARQQASDNIDTRQLQVVYKKNTRRIISACKRILDDVRRYSRFTQTPLPGAVEAFVGDVASIPPTSDVRPALRLAELVLACAVYGRRHNEFRHSIWQFPTEDIRAAFHGSMLAVSSAVALPPPDVLYEAGPPPPMYKPVSNLTSPQMHGHHSSGLSSPRPPLSPQLVTPPPYSPNPSISPQPLYGQYPISPQHISSPPVARMPHHPMMSPNPILPPGVMGHQHAASPRQPMTPPLYPHHCLSPRVAVGSGAPMSPSISMSPSGPMSSRPPLSPIPHMPSLPVTSQPYIRTDAPISPQVSTAPYAPINSQLPITSQPPISPPHSNQVYAARSHGSASSSTAALSPQPSHTPLIERSPRGIVSPRSSRSPQPAASRKLNPKPDISRQSSSWSPNASSSRSSKGSSKTSSRSKPRTRSRTSPQPSKSGLADLDRSGVPVAPYVSLTQDHSPHIVDNNDHEMGIRKFSIVTDDNGSRGSSSPLDAPKGSPEQGAAIYGNEDDLNSEFQGISSVTEHVVDPDFVQDMKSLERDHQQQERTLKRFDHSSEYASRSASDEFYTPNEQSPSQSEDKKESLSLNSRRGSASSSQFTNSTSTGIRGSSQYLAESSVDQNVRQSVTSSITKQISQNSGFGKDELRDPIERDASSGSGHGSSVGGESPLFPRGAGSSVDFNHPSYMLSPSASDAPSPSNQWQIARQKTQAEEVLSPQQLYSPPAMPSRLSRTTISTQMTPPPAPPLFRSGNYSPQLSESSNGANSTSDMDQQQQMSKNQRVSFAPSIISPGGHLRPLGQPLRDVSLPPSTADSTGDSSARMEESTEQRGGPSHQMGERGMKPPVYPTQTERFGTHVGESSGGFVQGPRKGEMESNSLSGDSSSDKHSIEDREDFEGYNSDDQNIDPEDQVQREELLREMHRESAGENIGSDEFIDANEDEKDPKFGIEGNIELARESNEYGIGLDQMAQDTELHENNTNESLIAKPSGSASASSSKSGSRAGSSLSSPAPAVERTGNYSASGFIPSYTGGSVPPTPPTPPDFQTLVHRFTERQQSPQSTESRPVSTMAPSAGLFRKLIAVLQGTENMKDGALGQGKLAEEALVPQMYNPDVSMSLSSTHDSTLPSGDTDVVPVKLSAALESPRSGRPRAIRIPPGLVATRELSASMQPGIGDQKLPDIEEKASVASFSDAFSSDDKERNWGYSGQINTSGFDWEEAMKGDSQAGIPVLPDEIQETRAFIEDRSPVEVETSPSAEAPSTPIVPGLSTSESLKAGKTHSISTGGTGVVMDGNHVKVDRRRLDWLTRELLAAQDAISRKELQMTFAETQRVEQQEILLLERQDAESVVEAMKKILSQRESELKEARSRLSVAIQSVNTAQDRSSHNSAAGESENFGQLIRDGNAKLHSRIEECDSNYQESSQAFSKEMRSLWSEVQRAMIEKMEEMTEKRDEELAVLRSELEKREKLVSEMQRSSADLVNRSHEYQNEASNERLEKQKASHRYELEMSHVTAQVELVNEFSKKLHDNFRETENLRQQVLQYQDKLSHITSTSGVSQRQIKELREAVTRANDECARLRREADVAKKKGMEAIRRAEELEELRIKDDNGHSAGRYPDRQDRTDSGSFRSRDPVRPPGHNRPGGSGVNARYHGATRGRGLPNSATPAQKAWLLIKDKLGGIVNGKEGSTSRRRVPGHSARRDYSRGGSGSQSSQSQSRSRNYGRDEDGVTRTRSGSVRSRSSNGSGSYHSGAQHSNRSGSGGRRQSPVGGSNAYMHTYPKGEVGRLRATDF